jgi:hypothetical protein
VEAIGRTYPDVFHDFNKHMWSLGGFHRPLKARTTPNQKANFHVPHDYFEHHEELEARNCLTSLRCAATISSTRAPKVPTGAALLSPFDHSE